MSAMRDDVVKWLKEAREKGATEVHFKVPNRPLMRVDGALLPFGTTTMTPALTHQIANALCGLANLEIALASVTDHEFAVGLHGVGRFQVNLYKQRGSTAIVVQRSGLEVPALTDLGFSVEAEQVLKGRGLVLIAGHRLRSALLGSLVDRYNATTRGCVVVIEDPLKYLHRDAMAAIAQRGVGTDVESLEAGIRAAHRAMPDLLAVGDIRDRKTAEALLDAAEDGILTLATVAAPRAAEAIAWITRGWTAADRPDVEARVRRLLKATLALPEGIPAELVMVPQPTAGKGFNGSASAPSSAPAASSASRASAQR